MTSATSAKRSVLPRQSKGRRSTGRQSTGRQKGGPAQPGVEGARLQSATLDWSSGIPKQINLPSAAELVNVSIEERQRILKQFGVTPSWKQMRGEAEAYVTRLTNHPPGSKTWRAEVERLTDWNSKQGSLRISRRAYKQFATLEQLRGEDPSKVEFVNVSEGDEAVCERCDVVAGEEGTMEHLASIGLPELICLGACRCERLRVN